MTRTKKGLSAISTAGLAYIFLLLRRRIGPKSVLRKIGYNVHGDESDDGSSTSEDDDPVTISRLPNGLKYRWIRKSFKKKQKKSVPNVTLSLSIISH